MGGGGHKTKIGRLGRSFSSEVDCKDLEIESSLYSPNPDVVAKLKMGSVLEIEYDPNDRTLIATFKGELAGTILGAFINQIINCIVEKSVRFKGTVIELEGGNCKLKISAI